MSIFTGSKEGTSEAPRRRASDQMPLSIVAHDLTVTGDLEAEGGEEDPIPPFAVGDREDPPLWNARCDRSEKVVGLGPVHVVRG